MAVPQAQCQTPIEAAKQAHQQIGCFLDPLMQRTHRRAQVFRMHCGADSLSPGPRCQTLGMDLLAHAGTPEETRPLAVGELCGRALLMPASFVRFNMSALIATTAELPDIESAAISGLSTNG